MPIPTVSPFVPQPIPIASNHAGVELKQYVSVVGHCPRNLFVVEVQVKSPVRRINPDIIRTITGAIVDHECTGKHCGRQFILLTVAEKYGARELGWDSEVREYGISDTIVPPVAIALILGPMIPVAVGRAQVESATFPQSRGFKHIDDEVGQLPSWCEPLSFGPRPRGPQVIASEIWRNPIAVPRHAPSRRI